LFEKQKWATKKCQRISYKIEDVSNVVFAEKIYMTYNNNVKCAFTLRGVLAYLQLIYYVFQCSDRVGMSGKRNEKYEPYENYV